MKSNQKEASARQILGSNAVEALRRNVGHVGWTVRDHEKEGVGLGVPLHVVHGEIGLAGGLEKSRLPQFAVVREVDRFVVDVAPIEAGEVVVAQPPRRRYEAGAGGAVEVPLADVDRHGSRNESLKREICSDHPDW